MLKIYLWVLLQVVNFVIRFILQFVSILAERLELQAETKHNNTRLSRRFVVLIRMTEIISVHNSIMLIFCQKYRKLVNNYTRLLRGGDFQLNRLLV